MNRRQALKTLFGAGTLGLRALATGLPAGLLLDPRKVLADAPPACDAGKAQFVIFTTSSNGDPVNANVPGTYEDAGIYHSADPLLKPTKLTLGGRATTAAKPWADLPQAVLDRTTFWHMMTDTPVHPKEPDVLQLMGATSAGEMLPSLLARHLAPCLGTIQAQPISLGASSPTEGLTYAGQALPIIPALALKATLTNPAGPLTKLQPLRDKTLEDLHGIYKNEATTAQRRYIDSMITSQSQVRNIRQDLLERLASITDNSVESQIKAAVTLIQMKITPVVAVHVPFGGDNHRDPGLAREIADTVRGVSAIGLLMSELAAAGLTDKVSLVSLNVFGRTLGADSADGRNHNENHQVSFTIGKGFKAGIVGGVGKVGRDYGALAIDPNSGAGRAGAAIAPNQSLASFGQTVMTAFGVPKEDIARDIRTGTVIKGALA